MPIEIVTIVAFCSFVGLIFFGRRLFDSRKGIQVRWEGAPKHLFAVGIGLFAFVILFALMLMLNLFESELFSWAALLDILQLSFVLLVGGWMIVLGVVMVSRVDSSDE